VHQDTIPSQLFPEEEKPKPRPKARKIGAAGVLLIAVLVALGGLAIAKLVNKLLKPPKK